MLYSRDMLLSLQSDCPPIRRHVRRRIFCYKLVSRDCFFLPPDPFLWGKFRDPTSVFVSERKRFLNIRLLNCRSIGN